MTHFMKFQGSQLTIISEVSNTLARQRFTDLVSEALEPDFDATGPAVFEGPTVGPATALSAEHALWVLHNRAPYQ